MLGPNSQPGAPLPGKIEKIMSIRRVEFEAGLARIDVDAPATNTAGVYTIPNRGGVTITFEKLAPAVLGGLMRLPRAKITIDVEALDQAARQQFVAFFEKTFQRGGG